MWLLIFYYFHLKTEGISNILGNLMIAQYQVDKLRSRLSERISGYGSASNKKTSVHVFKHNDKWYKVTTKVNEIAVADMKGDEIYSKKTE